MADGPQDSLDDTPDYQGIGTCVDVGESGGEAMLMNVDGDNVDDEMPADAPAAAAAAAFSSEFFDLPAVDVGGEHLQV